MLRPQRPRRPDPVAMATPIKPPNSTTHPKTTGISGRPEIVVEQKQPKPRPVIPRDPDRTEYESKYFESVCRDPDCDLAGSPHHHSMLKVYQGGVLGNFAKAFIVTGPSLFGNFRRLKVLLEEWRAAQEKTPPNE